MSEETKGVVLRTPEEAQVDDVSLLQNDVDNPKQLTEDQIARLKAVPGVKLEVLEQGEDPLDALKGKDLEERFKASGLQLEGNATADDKREALKGLRDQEGSGK